MTDRQTNKFSARCGQIHGNLVGGRTIGYRTHDRKVAGSTPGRATIKKLLLGWVTVSGQVNHSGI